MTYRIIDDSEKMGICKGYIPINEEGANIIWAAYVKAFGNCQTMQRREERGGICWMSELDHLKRLGTLNKDFNYKNYITQ